MKSVMNSPSGPDLTMHDPGVPLGTAPELPNALKLVATLTMIAGVVELIGTVNLALDHHLHVTAGILCLPAGIGLLKRRKGWRTFTIIMTLVWLLVSPVILMMFLLMSEPPQLLVFGHRLENVPDAVGILSTLTLFLGFVWQYRVLIRSDVRAAFGIPERSPGVSGMV